MIIVGLVLVGVLVVGVIVALGLRRITLDDVRTEARMHQPGAHTLSYVMPVGQDPALAMARLAHAGFTAVADSTGGVERVLVDCEEQDRAQVRSILEHVDRAGIAGPPIHVDHVSFEDER